MADGTVIITSGISSLLGVLIAVSTAEQPVCPISRAARHSSLFYATVLPPNFLAIFFFAYFVGSFKEL